MDTASGRTGMIEADGLSKRFGDFTAIEDVSFSVEAGEVIGFLGPNGAGKSTTMRILAGVFPPTHGRIVVAGRDVATDPLRARSIIGYFPERVSLYAEMTVERYLRYVGRLKGLPRATARNSIREALENTALGGVRDRIIATLSKGFRQRVGIAQALVGDPQVLLLDEPTSGLDPAQVTEMRELIRELRGARTVILSTHILSEVEATCDRVIIMNRGRLLAIDTPAALRRRLFDAQDVFVEIAAPEAEARARLAHLPGVLSVSAHRTSTPDSARLVVRTAGENDLREQISREIAAAGWAIRELRPLAMSLEEIFLSVVSGRSTR